MSEIEKYFGVLCVLATNTANEIRKFNNGQHLAKLVILRTKNKCLCEEIDRVWEAQNNS